MRRRGLIDDDDVTVLECLLIALVGLPIWAVWRLWQFLRTGE
jgi:hypothetical protein